MMLFTTISGMTTTDKPEPIREIIQVECMLETVPGKGVQLVFPINISGKGLATFNMTEDYLQKLYLAGKIRPAEVAPHA